MVSKSTYPGFPEHILKPMKMKVVRDIHGVAFRGQEVDFKKVAQNACISSKLGFEDSGGVAKWFGTDLRLIE